MNPAEAGASCPTAVRRARNAEIRCKSRSASLFRTFGCRSSCLGCKLALPIIDPLHMYHVPRPTGPQPTKNNFKTSSLVMMAAMKFEHERKTKIKVLVLMLFLRSAAFCLGLGLGRHCHHHCPFHLQARRLRKVLEASNAGARQYRRVEGEGG